MMMMRRSRGESEYCAGHSIRLSSGFVARHTGVLLRRPHISGAWILLWIICVLDGSLAHGGETRARLIGQTLNGALPQVNITPDVKTPWGDPDDVIFNDMDSVRGVSCFLFLSIRDELLQDKLTIYDLMCMKLRLFFLMSLVASYNSNLSLSQFYLATIKFVYINTWQWSCTSVDAGIFLGMSQNKSEFRCLHFIYFIFLSLCWESRNYCWCDI